MLMFSKIAIQKKKKDLNLIIIRISFILFPAEKLLDFIWDKVFKNGPSRICRKRPL